MQAVVLEQFGAASHLAVHTVPHLRPGPGEVLLRVRACGENRGVAGRLVLSPDAPPRSVA